MRRRLFRALAAMAIRDHLTNEAEVYVEANPLADDLTNLQRRGLDRGPRRDDRWGLLPVQRPAASR